MDEIIKVSFNNNIICNELFIRFKFPKISHSLKSLLIKNFDNILLKPYFTTIIIKKQLLIPYSTSEPYHKSTIKPFLTDSTNSIDTYTETPTYNPVRTDRTLTCSQFRMSQRPHLLPRTVPRATSPCFSPYTSSRIADNPQSDPGRYIIYSSAGPRRHDDGPLLQREL